MTPKEVVLRLLQLAQAPDAEAAAAAVTDDFVLATPKEPDLDKAAWLALRRRRRTAFSEVKIEATIVSCEGPRVTLMLQVTMKHTGPINSPVPGFSTIPATGKVIVLGPDEQVMTVRGDRVARIEQKAGRRERRREILEQLGMTLYPVIFG
jgi:hypothetical protein